MLTLTGMCCGITGIHAALVGKMSYAVSAILLAALFDGIDGRTARKLKVSSRFGAELDSLSDFATFGIAPSVVMFLFALSSLGKFGWAVALLFSMCMALRLARFNTNSIENSAPLWMEGLAIGVPAPAGAYLFLMPIMLCQWLGVHIPAGCCALWGLISACLLVSRIPTFLLKTVLLEEVFAKWDGSSIPLLMPVSLLLLIFIGCAYSFTGATMVAIGIAYITSLPFSFLYAKRKRERYSASVV
jgi:CDP-diacylglycerol--serine O-phosphatidyltransferase